MSRRIFNNPHVKRRMWYHIDASGMVVGRLAEKVSTLLQGKYKAVYNPSQDTGDYVVITNVDKLQFTGKKLKQKLYRWHTGYPGGLKEVPAWRMQERRPEKVLQHAVSGMLPKNRLRKERMRRLKVYTGDDHLHSAQLAHKLPVPQHLETEVKQKKEKEVKTGWIITYEDLGGHFELSGEKLKPPVDETKKKKRRRGLKSWEQTQKEFDTLVGPPHGWDV